MPMIPKTSASSGTMSGDASSMPTSAVNTMSETTLGLHSSKYSRHPACVVFSAVVAMIENSDKREK